MSLNGVMADSINTAREAFDATFDEGDRHLRDARRGHSARRARRWYLDSSACRGRCAWGTAPVAGSFGAWRLVERTLSPCMLHLAMFAMIRLSRVHP